MHPQANQFLFNEHDKSRYVALVGFQVANVGHLPQDGKFEVSVVGTANDNPKRVFLEMTEAQLKELDIIDVSKLVKGHPHCFNYPDIPRLRPVKGRVKWYKRDQMAVVQVMGFGDYEDTGSGEALVAQFQPSLGNYTLYTSAQDVRLHGGV